MKLEHLGQAQSARLRQAKSAARLVGLVMPITLTALGAVLLLIWLPRLPNPMAVHWNGAGAADGFGHPALILVMFPLINLLLTSMYFLGGLQRVEWLRKADTPVWGPMNRLLPAIVLGSVALMFIIQLGTTIPQLDLTDAHETPGTIPVIIAAYGGGILVTILTFLAQPKLRIDPSVQAGAGEPLDLGDTERANWFGAVRPSRAYLWIIGSTVLVLIGTVALVAAMRPLEWAPIIIVSAVTVFVIGFALVGTQFHVTVDERGFEARSVFGWPTFRVAATNIAKVEVREIAPFAEFGGWGLRLGADGTIGLVMRAGDGIRITKKVGRDLVVTLDDAATAASVLNTVVVRATEVVDDAAENDATDNDAAESKAAQNNSSKERDQ